ncbi:urease accessory protein UreF [Paenibacillus whitsoniae]|uniref:Urease accessory protein UreF n=1 Tax=Paenibacillus whitsoniae TaxID=2496558 RepID=A0A430JCW1_9BACL|nr:urease accessory protein UreF [Paenibacillus whitsoniae]RTE08847.1 urease accessory protein UreF [Paenibacillus whitsoniae]
MTPGSATEQPKQATAGSIEPRPRVHWLAYQQLLDSALPIGGFSHSFGLETLVQQERITSLGQLEAYIRGMLLQSWATGDAMVIKAAYQYMPQMAWQSLWDVDHMLHVARVSREARNGVQKMGRRLLQLAKAMHPDVSWKPLEEAAREGRCTLSHPVVHGWMSYLLGIPLAQAAEGYLYSCTVTCINSALRLMSIGQTEGQVLLARLIPAMAEAWAQAAHLAPEDAYMNTPAADLAMMQHETLYSRLFMS